MIVRPALESLKTFWRLLHDTFHKPESQSYRIVQPIIWVLIVFSIGLFGVEMVFGTESVESAWVRWLDWVVLVVFVLEIVLRVATYRPPRLDFFDYSPLQRLQVHVVGRLLYCLRPLNLVDLITVLALVPALRGLRAFRLLRLVRTSKIFRYSQPFEGLLRAFAENTVLFAFGISLLGVATLVGGFSIFLVERGHNSSIQTLSDGFWWALVTLTTVGYGDISPVTMLGRAVGVVLMLAGMFTLAVFAGIVGHALLNVVLSIREEQFRMSAYINHIVVCGYDPGARMLLDEVLKELEGDDREVLIFANSPRPQDVPPRFMWIQGDPTKESELDKIRLTHASAGIIVGSRTVTPQQADAITILTAFTIRSFLKGRPETQKRHAPLYLVAEVLDAENVEHAKAAGADEVIETTRLGFSLLAHAVSMPGTASVVSQVASFGAHSLYIRTFDGDPASFAEVAAASKREHGALIIGLRDSGSETINPSDDALVRAGVEILYLAEQAIKG